MITSDVKNWAVVITDTDDAGINRVLGPYNDYQVANQFGELYVAWLHGEYKVDPKEPEWTYHVSPLETAADAMANEEEEIRAEREETS